MPLKNSLRSLRRQRIRTSSYKDCTVSIASLHTETINIWSHLLATFWFLSSVVHFIITSKYPFNQDAAATLLYLVAITLCFGCSTLYHVFADHDGASGWLLFDHFGIVCAIWGTSVSFIAISFKYSAGERRLYMAIVTAAAALCLSRLSKIHAHDIKGRWSRLYAHITLGAVATLPGLHCLYLTTLGQHSLLREFGGLVFLNSIGGGIYATRFLDKIIGTKIGMPGTSHHAMHVLVVAGALVYQRGLLSICRGRSVIP